QDTPGIEIEPYDYLRHPPSIERLKDVYARAGITPHEGLRRNEELAKALELADASEAAVLEAMAKHPVLVERPIVETEKGVRLGRPPENIRDIL
ncbi:MAG: ArsC/Spx/MgsR family protein, partial [Pseudomonadota bacterium]